MEKGDRKKGMPDINEELMMSIMAGGVKKDGLQVPPEPTEISEQETKTEKIKQGTDQNNMAVKEMSRSKKTTGTKKMTETDYERLFFKRSETNASDGKTVYIRPEFHEKMTRIIQVIGEDKISIYAYLDNLLDYHFLEFGEQIILNQISSLRSI